MQTIIKYDSDVDWTFRNKFNWTYIHLNSDLQRNVNAFIKYNIIEIYIKHFEKKQHIWNRCYVNESSSPRRKLSITFDNFNEFSKISVFNKQQQQQFQLLFNWRSHSDIKKFAEAAYQWNIKKQQKQINYSKILQVHHIEHRVKKINENNDQINDH